jgi:hypothetical protein
MASDSNQAWNEVERHFSDVGRRLKEHYEKLDAAKTTPAERQKLDDALRSLTEQMDKAFTAVGDALRDPEAQESLRQGARSFGNAVAATFSDVGEEIRKRVGRRPPDGSA